jgi:hypothetical protein
MNCPVFKTGMVFSNMQECRKALNAYSVNERVKIRKTRNEAKMLHAQCEEGCPWMIKVSQDSRTEAFVVREFCETHTCERVWELKIFLNGCKSCNQTHGSRHSLMIFLNVTCS